MNAQVARSYQDDTNLSKYPDVPRAFNFIFTKLQTSKYFYDLPDPPDAAIQQYSNHAQWAFENWGVQQATPEAIELYDDILFCQFTRPLRWENDARILLRVDGLNLINAPYNFSNQLKNRYMFATMMNVSAAFTLTKTALFGSAQSIRFPACFCDSQSAILDKINARTTPLGLTLGVDPFSQHITSSFDTSKYTYPVMPVLVMAYTDIDLDVYRAFAWDGYELALVPGSHPSSQRYAMVKDGNIANYPTDIIRDDYSVDSIPVKLGMQSPDAHRRLNNFTRLIDVPHIIDPIQGLVNDRKRHLILVCQQACVGGNIYGSRQRIHLYCPNLASTDGDPVDCCVANVGAWYSRSFVSFDGPWKPLAVTGNQLYSIRFALRDDIGRPVEFPPDPKNSLNFSLMAAHHNVQ